MLSIGNHRTYGRLQIETEIDVDVSLERDSVVDWSWVNENTELPQGESFNHVMINGFQREGDGISVDETEVPVNPSRYPTEEVTVELFENANGHKWAIGKNSKGQLLTFFFKKKEFGNYWICSEVNNSKSSYDRIVEKEKKGYRQLFSTWVFHPDVRIIGKN